ncbi:MAG: tetratricopeptide repeat protein [Nitrospirae bacterium]|nr:tetratricopeptide repeat protein [Nitrospirota bacterium]
MAKFSVFLIILFLLVVGVLAFFNKDTVNLTVWNDVMYEVPVIGLILISTATGILAMFIIFSIRDARRFLSNWQFTRRQKKDLKIQESYARGLDAFFACRYEEARDLFDRVIKEDPSHENALLRLGDIAFNEGDYAMAKEFYTMAKEIRPGSVEVLLSLEKIFEAQHKWKESLKYLDTILDIDDENPEILQKKRDIYEKDRKWEDVLEVQHKILKCDLPDEEEKEEQKKFLGYKYELGCRYLETNNTDKAVKTLRSVIKSDKDFTPAYIALAEAYLKDGNTDEAQDVLMKGFEATSSLVLLVRLEDFFITMGEPGTIIDLYQKAIQKEPREVKLQFFLAKLYYRLEMIDYAYETISTLDMSAYDFPDFHILLGSIYQRRSQHERAAEEFRKALKADKPLLVPFCCSGCGYSSKDWAGRCASCKSWNTFILNTHEICKPKKRQSSS